MKVAVVRGPSLNAWEMQTYAPLALKNELVAVGSKRGHYGTERIDFPVHRLHCLGEYLAFVPEGTSLLYRIFGDPGILIGFDRIITGFDIVHAAELTSNFSFQAVQAKMKGLVRAVTLTIYENIPGLGDEVPARKRLKQGVIESVDHFMAASKGAREALLREGVAAARISVVPQGIDTRLYQPRRFKIQDSRFKKLREQYGFVGDDFLVLSVGRMVEEKGFEDLVRAAHHIEHSGFRVEGREIRFLLVGEGPEKKRLEELVKDLNLGDSVVFAGNVAYGEMPDLYSMSDFFVLASRPTPTWKEQFGYVLIEAMASGLPIVGTRTGAIPEVVGKRGSRLVLPADPAALAEAILALASDEILRRKMSRANLQRVRQRYDAVKVAASIEDIWRTVIADAMQQKQES